MKILISQKAPSNTAAYDAIANKYGAQFEFRPFFLVQPLSVNEFRAQRVNPADFTAVTFSSRHAIDAYFALCDLVRFKVPESMKYFCTTEQVATYLQKHIVYRKRKIFYGDGTPASVVALASGKHKDETFLITGSDASKGAPLAGLFTAAGLKNTSAAIIKSVPQDLSDLNLHDYGIIVLYNPSDVQSLFENFPSFEQGDLKIMAYGKSVVKAIEDAGLRVDITGPTPGAPSVAKTLEVYLSK